MKKEVTVTCEYCGTAYDLSESEYKRKVKKGTRFFCCFEHYRLASITVDRKKVCPVCGKEFLSKWGTTYCSKSCSNSAVHRRKSGRLLVEFVCLNCGKSYHPWSRGKLCSKFCSHECSVEYKNKKTNQRIEETGEFTKQGHEINRDQAIRYLTEKYGYKCSICGISDWQGKHLTLVVDHINGNSSDNRVENVRLLCPNCDSQTITYKNRHSHKSARTYRRKYYSRSDVEVVGP